MPVSKGLDDAEFVDPKMQGLSLNDQKWYVVSKGFDQVKQFCDDIGLPQYYELFLQNKYNFGNKIRSITQFELQDKFKLTDEDEIEAILAQSAELVKRDEITEFAKKYGDPDSLIFECEQGLKFISDHSEWWKEDEMKERGVTEKDAGTLTFAEKWSIPDEDFANFSKTEGLWATASSCDGMIFLWPLDRPLDNAQRSPDDVTMPGVVRSAYGHPYVCTDYCMDWEKMISISCGGDCRVVFFDMEKSKIIGTIKNDKGIDVTQAYLSVDGDFELGKVAVGCALGPLKIGDAERGKIVQVLKGHTDDIYDVKANWDENLIATGSWDHTMGMFDLRSGKRVRTMTGHSCILNRIDVCFEQMMAMSFAAEQPMMMWDLKDGRCVKTVQGHFGGNNDGIVNWQTMEAVTGGEDGLVRRWNLETGKCTKTINCDHMQTLAVDVNWEKGLLMTGSWDMKVRIWDLQTGHMCHELKKARRTITQVHIQGGRGSG